jgi:hypothetical protein
MDGEIIDERRGSRIPALRASRNFSSSCAEPKTSVGHRTGGEHARLWRSYPPKILPIDGRPSLVPEPP